LNSAIPFTLYGFAGIHLPASTMAFLNATAPMFGLLIGAAFGTERVTARKIAGLVVGSAGVALVARPESVAGAEAMSGLAVIACLGACFSYALSGLAISRWGRGVPSRGIALGSQLAGAFVLAPFLPFTLPQGVPSAIVVANLLALGLLASGLALVVYFRLMAAGGATRALTVTYLVPVFAFAWAALFLGETLTAGIAAGGVLILAGTVLVTRG
jgi:drug/metabolite transporter (DMT)-like permease